MRQDGWKLGFLMRQSRVLGTWLHYMKDTCQLSHEQSCVHDFAIIYTTKLIVNATVDCQTIHLYRSRVWGTQLQSDVMDRVHDSSQTSWTVSMTLVKRRGSSPQLQLDLAKLCIEYMTSLTYFWQQFWEYFRFFIIFLKTRYFKKNSKKKKRIRGKKLLL